MNKKIGRPHEGVRSNDGLDAVGDTNPTDTEGHNIHGPGTGGDLRGPGTGGDVSPRTPSSGGEFIDDNDVEGHSR